MKVLAIGNSFSRDATRYLREIAKKGGNEFKVINLYIPACSLYKHYINILSNKDAYGIQVDAMAIGFNTSIQTALASDDWDVVTLQQGSKNSFDYKNYEPYLDLIAQTVKTYSPKAKIFVHQTWAYENGASIMSELTPYQTATEMFNDIRACYNKMKKQIKADGIITSGELVETLAKKGIKPLYLADGHHMSRGIGRYAVALLWYATLTKKDISNIDFNDFDEEVKKEDVEIIKQTVKELVK